MEKGIRDVGGGGGDGDSALQNCLSIRAIKMKLDYSLHPDAITE